MVGLATETERGFSLFRKLGLVLCRAVEGGSGGVGEEWPEVLVGGAKTAAGEEPERGYLGLFGAGVGVVTPTGVLGPDER